MTQPGDCLHEKLITMILKADQDRIELDEEGSYYCSLCMDYVDMTELRKTTVKKKITTKYHSPMDEDVIDVDYEVIDMKPKELKETNERTKPK